VVYIHIFPFWYVVPRKNLATLNRRQLPNPTFIPFVVVFFHSLIDEKWKRETTQTIRSHLLHTYGAIGLGDFRPLGDCLLWALFRSYKRYICVNFYKNGLGYILGYIFTSLSGHPEKNQKSLKVYTKEI
jgi:hypothetical protein